LSIEDDWFEDDWLASRMQIILRELKNKYPDADISPFLNRAAEGFVPNPLQLESSGKKENIVLAGLIHREYALSITAGIINASFESGKATIEHEGNKIDITNEKIELLPDLAIACCLSIRDLSVDDVLWSEDIDELIGIVSFVIYAGVLLRNVNLMENLLTILISTASSIKNSKVRQKFSEQIYKDLTELGLSRLGQIFMDISTQSS